MLQAIHLRGTARLLSPRYQHLSPCLGATLTIPLSPVLRNLIKLDKFAQQCEQQQQGFRLPEQEDDTAAVARLLLQSARLAHRLFFEPHPGAPLRLSRNKSLPAAHLTPKLMGTLQGLALNLGELEGAEEAKQHTRKILKEHCGIRSNYVNQDEWTGVSLARWNELIQLLTVPPSQQDCPLPTFLSALPNAVWSAALWHQCTSKECLWRYFVALERASASKVLLLTCNSDYRTEEEVKTEWIREKFDGSIDLGQHSVQSSLNKLLQSAETNEPIDNDDLARALEIVCAATVAQGQITNKPVVPNGHYGFDGGAVKPDCVEVAVRELMDLLLWNEQTATFEVQRLPASARPELVALYTSSKEAAAAQSNDVAATKPPDEAKLEGDQGQKWFDLLSNMPGCDYLSVSPNGKPYELTPTMRNMARVLQKLLYPAVKEKNKKEWTSLVDLQQTWEPKKGHSGGHQEALHILLDTITERAKMSDDLLVHEVATVQKRSGDGDQSDGFAMEIRLRCDWARNTGFATVTHLQKTNHRMLVAKEHLDALGDALARNGEKHNDACLSILALALMGEHGLQRKDPPPPTSAENPALWLLCCHLLACPYGLDRRHLMDLLATTDLEREARAHAKALRESQGILEAAVRRICDGGLRQQSDADVLACLLLGWILTESPQVVSADAASAKRSSMQPMDSSLEPLLLSFLAPIRRRSEQHQRRLLPPVMTGLSVHENWACRGRLLSQWLLNEKGSLGKSLREFKPWHFFSLLWLRWRHR